MCYFPRPGPPTGPPRNNVSDDEMILLLLPPRDAHRHGLVCVLNADIPCALEKPDYWMEVL